MKLSEMKHVLAQRGLRLTKSLGQNFMHDANQLRRMLELAELKPEDRLLEIGPGLGPLTELLLSRAKEVLAIEKDRRLVDFLRERFGSSENLAILEADALDYLRGRARDWSDWKVVANLPYSVASPLLVELAQAPKGPARLVVTLQFEVAKRLVAVAGHKDYGVLTLLCQFSYEPGVCFKIPAGCFFPKPDVDSACVSLQRRTTPLLESALRPVFEQVVKRAFSQRRKTMRKLLRADWPEERLEAAFEDLKLSPQTRAEDVGLEDFAKLTRTLARGKRDLVPQTTKSARTSVSKAAGPSNHPAAPNDLADGASGAKKRSASLKSETQDASPPPAEEIFDVVNEHDEVIGQNTRAEVHRLGLQHRAVHVLVFNRRGEVFLQKRSMRKDRQPGLWDSSVSGHVDSGESYDACAARELHEEIGLVARTPPRRLFKLAACPETDQEHVWVYRHEAEGPFRLHPEEIERGEWRAPKAVSRWMAKRPEEFASALRLIWQRLDL